MSRERGRERERRKQTNSESNSEHGREKEPSSSRKTIVSVDSRFMQVPAILSALGLITAHFYPLILNYPLPFMPIGVNFSYF